MEIKGLLKAQRLAFAHYFDLCLLKQYIEKSTMLKYLIVNGKKLNQASNVQLVRFIFTNVSKGMFKCIY